MKNLLSVLSVVAMAAPTLSERLGVVIALTLWISGFLCVLNIGLAIFYRLRTKREVFSYYAVCLLELAIFVFALLIRLEVITRVPYHLPPGLSINRAEIGAALAIGIGLFPAAFWHRTNVSDLPARLAEDAKVMQDRDGGVRIRKSTPGEWMN
ncbi:MAG: hypothetical protein E6J34_00565 [Chloroflexi bacterium]|nr:MAG: hypothetical protein E6J34_00565 [Chloroflexota bacterium]